MNEEVIEVTVVEVLPPKVVEGRDATTGRFLKGNKLRPEKQGKVGRPRKLDSGIMLQAIHDAFTPEEVTGLLRQARDIAVKNDDAKSVLEVARLVLAYAIGKPVQRSIKAMIEPEEFAALFMNGGEEEVDEIDE
jgi:hypothetical protein